MHPSTLCHVGGSGNHRPELPPLILRPRQGEVGFRGAFSGAPSLAESLVLARLATSNTLLPTQVARLISALSVISRFNVQLVGLFIEVMLEAAKRTTAFGLGFTRRALIAAIGSARAMNLIDSASAASSSQLRESTEGFTKVLDYWTNCGIYMIHHTFSLAELYAMSGFYLTQSIIKAGFTAAQESVKLLESMLGSNETSRALASIITLVRDELTQDPRFTPAERGEIASLTALTKALTAYVCLQCATHKRTLKEMRLRVVYDCTIVLEDVRTGPRDFNLADYGRRLDERPVASPPASPTPSMPPRERTVSVNDIMTDFRSECEANGGRAPRSRHSSARDEVELRAELEDLCGSSDEDDLETEAELPESVRNALREVGEDGPESVKRTVRTSGSEFEFDYEIETTETTTKTRTTIRAVDRDSAGINAGPRTISRKTRTHQRVPSQIRELEPGTDVVEEASEDEWVELSTVVTEQDAMDEDEIFASLGELPSATNGANTVALLSRRDTIDHPAESKERFQFVIEKLTKTLTQRKRTIRRVDTSSRSSSPAPGTRPKLFDRNLGKTPKREARPSPAELNSAAGSPKSKGGGVNVFRALGRAIRKTTSVENLPSSRSVRTDSSGSIQTIAGQQSPATTPPLPSHAFPPAAPLPSTTPNKASQSSFIPIPASPDTLPVLQPSLFTSPATPPKPTSSTTSATLTAATVNPSTKSRQTPPFASGAPHDRQQGALAPPVSPLRNAKAALATTASRPDRLRRTTSNESLQSVTTTVTQITGGPEPEESEPKAANFPRQHLVRNLLTFMRYSSAAYGQTFLRILGMGRGDFNFPHTDHDHANNYAFAQHVGIDINDVLLSSYSRGDGDGSIWPEEVKLSPIVTYIAVDHENQAVVLSCRGSLGLSDLLVDLTCAYEQVPVRHGVPGEAYYAHSGMYSSATMMQRGTIPDAIRRGLQAYPGYGLVLCGHSLGGGVAALLSVLWSMPTKAYLKREGERHMFYRRSITVPTTPFVTSGISGLPEGRPIMCYSYGPPSTVSPDLAKYCHGLVISTVHNYDIVPTLSLGVVRDLKTTAMAMYTDSGMVEEIVGRVIGLHQRRFMANRAKSSAPAQTGHYSHPLTQAPDEALEVPLSDAELDAGRGSNRAKDPAYRDPSLLGPDISDDTDLNDWMWSLVRTMRAGNDAEKIYPPGVVYIIESWSVFVFSETGESDWRRPAKQTRREGRRVVLRLVEDVVARFSEPVFGRTMMSDHSPSGYEEQLENLAFAMA